jgi:hypothetical protein
MIGVLLRASDHLSGILSETKRVCEIRNADKEVGKIEMKESKFNDDLEKTTR